MPKELMAHSLWWEGPQWLQIKQPEYPPQPLSSSTISNSELKAACHVTSSSSLENLIWIESKYSSYTQLVRILACILWFTQNIRAQKTGTSPIASLALTVVELRMAKIFLYTSFQSRSLGEECRRRLSGTLLKSYSLLLCLNPTIGSNGLLRVGGRLKNSSHGYSQRHPIIIHGKTL